MGDTGSVDRSRATADWGAGAAVHGSRPVPSAALPGVLGAGMTMESGAIVPPNVIPAEAGTQDTGQQ